MHHTHYHRPASVAEAIRLMGEHPDDKVLAGGQSTLPSMKLGLLAPEGFIDLAGVGELKGIRVDGSSVVIGAMTTHAEVAASKDVQSMIPALAQLAGGIGDRAVRNRGTLGGSIAHSDPASDLPATTLALGATYVAQGPNGTREIPAGEFFHGIHDAHVAALFETFVETSESHV